MIHVDHGDCVSVLGCVEDEADFVELQLGVDFWDGGGGSMVDGDLCKDARQLNVGSEMLSTALTLPSLVTGFSMN